MSRSHSASTTVAQARVRSATLCSGQLSPPLEDAISSAAAVAGSNGGTSGSTSQAVWALRTHSPPPALAERVAAWREVNREQRPAATLGLRRNKSLTHREAGAGSFLHSDPSPSPIPPSLENSPYLQSEASPFYRRARLPGRAATSSVVPTLKSLNLTIDVGSTVGAAPSACFTNSSSPAAAGSASGSWGESIVDSPRPAYPRRPGLQQRPASTPTRRAVSESSSGRSSSSNSGDSDSEGSVTGGWTPRTPPLRAVGLPGSPIVGGAGVEPAQKARPGMPPARASYPILTGSGKVHPPGRPTLAVLLPQVGSFQMERIERPPVRVSLADRP